jgi:preprotein translocase subunit SecA
MNGSSTFGPQSGTSSAGAAMAQLAGQLRTVLAAAGLLRPAAGSADFLASVRSHQSRWQAWPLAERAAQLRKLQARLSRDGWAGPLRAEALGCVAAAAVETLARSPFDAQLQAASALLDDRLVEMATGEGKTLSVALAAAVVALAGMPVHAMTANDYLARRDALGHQGFFAHLGLSVGTVTSASTPAERRTAYRCHITYCTAREVAFDTLRDSLDPSWPRSEWQRRSARLSGIATAEPLVCRLGMAILDEADSLLIDEATTPLVISEAVDDAAHRAACFQALAVARSLTLGTHFHPNDEGRRIEWTAAGDTALAVRTEGLEGAWHNARHRHDLVTAALEALHLLRRDQHYLVRDGAVHLLDAVTGRVSPGRVWSRGLQTLVELKEGLAPSKSVATRGQIGFPHFFNGYERLCGLSGSLQECRAELRALYQRAVVRIALRLPSKRRVLPDRLYADAASRQAAAVACIAALQAEGRPVLVGTDSVADSESLSAALSVANVVHRVLNARHDADESAIVAAAGAAGAVTVATRMAGRGTDIALGAGVAALGGLHVLNLQDNPSSRLDLQLIGRCARQGDPGSAESWRTVAPLAAATPVRTALLRRLARADAAGRWPLPARWLRHWVLRIQAHEQQRAARHRRRFIQQDALWTPPHDANRQPA